MKKLLIMFSMFFLNFLVVAQTYVPFPTNNASWKESIGCSIFDISITGDSTINGQTYHKLIAHEKEIHRDPKTMQCHPLGSYTMHYNIYFGAFRNDSANKQIWYVPPGKTTDTLLYDFNLSKGDTLQASYNYDAASINNALYVVRIDSINLGNKWRKRFTLNDCSGSPSDSIRLIEGIGSDQSLLNSLMYCPYFGLSPALVCTVENGVTIYPNSATSCNIITSLKNDQQKEQKLDISPNPTQGQIAIPAVENLAGIQIFNLQGQKVQEFLPNQSGETQVQLNGPSGIYLIQLQMKDGNVESMKVVKR